MYHYAGNNPVTYTDPDGRETKKGVDINLLPQNEEKHNVVKNKILDSKTFFIAAHGNRNMIYEYPNASPNSETRGAGRAVPPEELVKRIKNHKNYKPKMNIVIWACNTGKQENFESDCYAQQLADAFGDGTKVLAPNSYYFISEDPQGLNFIGLEKEDGTPDFDSPRGQLKSFTGSNYEK